MNNTLKDYKTADHCEAKTAILSAATLKGTPNVGAFMRISLRQNQSCEEFQRHRQCSGLSFVFTGLMRICMHCQNSLERC